MTSDIEAGVVALGSVERAFLNPNNDQRSQGGLARLNPS